MDGLHSIGLLSVAGMWSKVLDLKSNIFFFFSEMGQEHCPFIKVEKQIVTRPK
jgi:hypothetical protein